MRHAVLLLPVLIAAGCGGFDVPGIDGTLGLSAPQPFYYGHPGVPVQIQIANLGDTAAPADVVVQLQLSQGATIADQGPAGWTCAGGAPQWTCSYAGSLPAGGTLPDLELEVALGTPDEAKDTLRVCPKLVIKEDVNQNNNSTCESFPVVPPTADYDLMIEKVVWNAYNPATERATYKIDVTNLGPDPVFDLSVAEDVLPPGLSTTLFGTSGGTNCNFIVDGVGCSYTQIAAGQTRSFSIQATFEPGMSGTITNCATVSAPQDFELDNNEACVSFELGAPEPFDIAVTAEIHSEPNGPFSGVYRWYLENLGSNPTSEPVELLIDAPPAGTTLSYVAGIHNQAISPTGTSACTPVGGQLSCRIVNVFQPGDVKMVWMSFKETPGSLSSAPACLSIDPPADSDASNNGACLELDVSPPPPIGGYTVAMKLSQRGEATEQEPGALRLSLENTGDDEAPGPIVATLELPPEVRFVGLGGHSGFTCVGGDITRAGQLVTCFQEASMAPGASTELDLAVWYEGAGEAEVCGDVAPTVGESKVSAACAGLGIRRADVRR